MQDRNALIIARRYAMAFLDVTHEQLSLSQMRHVQEVATFMQERADGLVMIDNAPLPLEEKVRVLTDVLNRYHIPSQLFTRLIALLVHHKRIRLLPAVFAAMVKLYKKKNHISVFTIKSAHPLSEDQQKVIQQFLAAQVPGVIESTFAVDPRLIAGLRLESDELVWEHSIDKELRSIELSLIR